MVRENPLTRRLRHLVLLSVLLGAAGAVAADEPAPRSLLQNGDFELGPSSIGGPAMWGATRVPQFAEHVELAWEDSLGRGGGHAVSIAIRESHPDDVVHYSWSQYVLAYAAGATYRVSAWIRTENVTDTAFVVVQCWDRAMTQRLETVSNQGVAEVVGTSDWTRVELTIEVPEETGRMLFLVGLAAPANRGGKAWFDDVGLLPLAGD